MARVAKRTRNEVLAAPPPALPAPVAEPAAPVDLFQIAAPAPVAEPVATVTPFARPASAKAAVGGKLAKPGIGLCVRMPDGEDSLTPFRSIEDLLSAIKPILRATARNPETVWFSLQPVDLATIDSDAA